MAKKASLSGEAGPEQSLVARPGAVSRVNDPVLVPAGSGIRIMPGVRHQIRNPSSSPLRLLVISHPPSHGDKFEAPVS